MRVWRIARRAFATTALTEYGAAQRGGRWNSRGVPVVYTADHRSLALLELLAHAEDDELPTDYEFLGLEVPDDSVLDVGELPDGWDVSPHTPTTCEIGDRWIANAESVALRVPSVLVFGESNVMLNPMHPRFGEVKVVDRVDARIDERFL